MDFKIFKDIVTKDDYLGLNKREYHLKWCKNCQHSKMNLDKGLICNLTNELASFNNSCEDYSANKATIEKNIKIELENDNSVTIVKNIFDFKLNKVNKKKLPEILIVKNKRIPNTIFYTLLMDLLLILMLILFGKINPYAVTLILASSILPIAFILTGASDQSPKMIITKSEIEILNTKIKISNLLAFYVERYEKTSKQKEKVLILRDINNVTDFTIRLSGLNYNHKQIIEKILNSKIQK